MAVGSVALAFVAGVLSTSRLACCRSFRSRWGAAASEHRGGPVALAAGLAVSFVLIGLFAATIGYSIGLNADIFRYVAAILMIVVGAVLLVPHLQARLALAGAPLANWSDRHFRGVRRGGLPGQRAMPFLVQRQ
jgi:cytochrome c biogenesis protein CcdA